MFLITSPHPDDDIVGLGDYIAENAKENKDICVWFCTDGGDECRIKEAENALAILGVTNIVWKTLPFYHKRNWNEQDVEVALEILNELKPTKLAINWDCDPRCTHVHCAEVLQKAVSKYN